MVKKILKVVLILVAIVIAICLLLFGIIWASMEWNRYTKTKEKNRYQKEVCDTITTVNETVQLKIFGFKEKELKKVHFYLQQGKLLQKDTIMKVDFNPKYAAQDVLLPFKYFNKKDRVIVNVGDRYFVLSGIRHYASFNYGMFGPVGSCDCEMGNFEIINGKKDNSAMLTKEQGFLNDPLLTK
ncbi:hypothetical protein OQZ33_18015 [Pedobacter sp. MC2016-05]|uniref:hypothetical protein n=1 Tax=Pedobacter sp. MC2016-05 TaxID=2994474 RepID=UPI00224624C5|nr:hypothetical protein [Pedobacter sp. MC2016-05]MCX2476235.1 hypothetical protein [Pedobacter sp. MC2016-05]